MLLKKLKVKNFLSVKGECELPIDPRVTVLLGANDHGKTNLLRALEHLNLDQPITPEEQNWDAKEPVLEFVFKLEPGEKKRLKELRDEIANDVAERLEQKEKANEVADEEIDVDSSNEPSTKPNPVAGVPKALASYEGQPQVQNTKQQIAAYDEEDEDEDPSIKDVLYELQTDVIHLSSILEAEELVLARRDVGSGLLAMDRPLTDFSDDVQSLFERIIPRVEVFRAFSGELQDSIKADEIAKEESEFIQGVFFYAGLDPLNCKELFNQDDETDKTLELASIQLDRELRKLWAQGVELDLHFQLKHRGTSIELLAKDPAVKRRQARMSKRSSGVTQFFRLSMVLHARRMKNPANSYIYVFDEPGVFLHPKGQKDLLAVFEQLAEDTQIIYATHSLFMLNQNYPERHRLIARTTDSTIVDAKPYRANWRYAVDALGVRLTANILFSPNILLVEGDSDPIYLYELLRVLNHIGTIDADANLLGIMSYGDLPNLRFLLQTFRAESRERRIAVLFEGDSQGREYQKQVSQLCKVVEAKSCNLEAGNAIEDYCLYPALFLEAVKTTIRQSYDALAKATPNDLDERLEGAWNDFNEARAKTGGQKSKKGLDSSGALGEDVGPQNGRNQNIGNWFKNLSEELVGSGGSSKVALARNYAFLARENEVKAGLDSKKVQLAKSLLEPVIDILGLPKMKAKKSVSE